ncbi:MAG TPA: CocE/NonD family hydrolase [Streptosporangiaceae bacterium]|nr:CocE/NonD family hydrolase [Streptosporangiaceae bacterium]
MGGRSARVGKTRPDKPWRRPGAVRYALRRVPGLLRPPVDVYEPEPGSLTMLKDLPVTVRDGATLRVNVVLPTGDGPFPALLSAHPYGKDNLPRRGRTGYRVSVQYRMLRQPDRVRFSSLTGWEAPDPAWWAGQGYAVVNCDLRGAGTSEGTCAIWSDQEGEDVYDLIEWAAAQPWSTGAILGHAVRGRRPARLQYPDRRRLLGMDCPRRHGAHRPMALRLWVAARSTADVNLFAGAEKWRGRSYVPFEGSYGFGRDRITTGWLKASLRGLDRGESRPFEPVPACTSRESLEPGKVVTGSRPFTSRVHAGNAPCTGDPGGGPGC